MTSYELGIPQLSTFNFQLSTFKKNYTVISPEP